MTEQTIKKQRIEIDAEIYEALQKEIQELKKLVRSLTVKNNDE